MMLKSKKRLIALATTAIFSLSTATALYAEPVIKTLKANFPGIKISYNGQVKTGEKEPFIVDNVTYVPIRMVGELVGKNVQWDGANKFIQITDTSSSSPEQTETINQLKAQLAQKDAEIIQLNQKNSNLEKQLEELQNKKSGAYLDDLEEELNEYYGEFEDIVFDIELDGDEDNIEVEITTDLYDYSRYWSRLSDRDIEYYIEDICKDIWDVYENAEIDGYIYDLDERAYLVEFIGDSRHRIDIELPNNVNLSDLEYDIDREYRNYFSDIKFSYFEIDGDSDSVVFNVNLDYDAYRDEWNALDNSKIETFMDNIYADIEYELRDAEIEGYIYTTRNRSIIAEYWITKSGGVRFNRYNP